MTTRIKDYMKRLIGRRAIGLWRDYSSVPRLLLQELRRILALTRWKRRYDDNPEVLLCALRTAAHIVDKGLQADNWEKGRGQAPYGRLCKQIERVKNLNVSSDPSYQWALEIKAEHEAAQKFGRVGSHSTTVAPSRITKYDLLYSIQSRRSIRSFEDRPIPIDVLDELANVISWSPTSCNRQPTRLFITQNPEKIDTCLEQCAGATCLGKHVPCFIAVCADTRFYMLRDRNLPFIDASLGVQNMLLMAHCQGIEGTILNWMHHTSKEDAALRSALSIPEYYLIILNLIIGHPSRAAPAPARKCSNAAYSVVE